MAKRFCLAGQLLESYGTAAAVYSADPAAGDAACSGDPAGVGSLKKLCCSALTALMRFSGSYAIICRSSST